MTLGHEKLDIYRLSIGLRGMGLREGRQPDRGPSLRARSMASRQIPLNIAEGSGKTSEADHRRYLEIARGSALQCAAIQDVLVVGKALDKAESRELKIELDRMAAMLSRLGGRGYCVKEDPVAYGKIDFDSDRDRDPDKSKSQQVEARGARSARQ